MSEATDLDEATREAVAALAYRIRERDALIRDGGEVPDAELAALEFMTAMRGRGWRQTAAQIAPDWKAAVTGAPATKEAKQAAIDEYLANQPWFRKARPDATDEDGAS